MLRRLLLGLVKGTLLGGAVGAALVFGLGMPGISGLVAYAATVVTGVCVALVAGRPIWASGAWVEVLLKGIAGAAIGVGLLYVARNYMNPLASLGPLGAGSLAELPLVILPAVATVLAVFFELDNTEEADSSASEPAALAAKRRVGSEPPSSLEQEQTEADADADADARRRTDHH